MVNVNLVAVVVSAIVAMVLGMAWFGPLFGKKWMALMKFNEKDMEKAKKSDMTMAYVGQFVAALVTAYVLAYFVGYAGAKDATSGAIVGFLAWIGFVATTTVGSVLWEGKPKELYLLNNGHMLINFLNMGAILAVLA